MVDIDLPILESDPRPLRYLFLDLNSYFASVEQQEDPTLRGRPVGVGAVMSNSGTIIAASYEAKAYGVKTGTKVGDAKRLCPEIVLLEGQPKKYVWYHHRILEAVESVLPVDKVCSIDEMRFRLLGEERAPNRATEIARAMKQAIYAHVGDQMRCSIGIAPNPFVAKLGTEMQKPDGLVVLPVTDLPHRLGHLRLMDFTGINRRMQTRLQVHGIFTGDDLCRADRKLLHVAFGSIIGYRWWFLLRGYDLPEEERARKTLGHSHVLPPNLRHTEGVREVLLRLLHKALARLRSENLWAATIAIRVTGRRKSWECRTRLPAAQDTGTFQDWVTAVWPTRDFVEPLKVAVTLGELRKPEAITPSLFDDTQTPARLSRAIDGLNQKFGKNIVHLAGYHRARDTAAEKIAFSKTWLFSEGKGDNDWARFRLPDKES